MWDMLQTSYLLVPYADFHSSVVSDRFDFHQLLVVIKGGQTSAPPPEAPNDVTSPTWQ